MIEQYDIDSWITRQLNEMSVEEEGIWLRPSAADALKMIIQRLADPNCEGSEEVIEAILAFRTFRVNSSE